MALAAKVLARIVIELDCPYAQVVAQPQQFAAARRQLKDTLVREEGFDGQCERAAEKVCPVGLLGLLGLLGLRHSSMLCSWAEIECGSFPEWTRVRKGGLIFQNPEPSGSFTDGALKVTYRYENNPNFSPYFSIRRTIVAQTERVSSPFHSGMFDATFNRDWPYKQYMYIFTYAPMRIHLGTYLHNYQNSV
jgi:hypothetical protein